MELMWKLDIGILSNCILARKKYPHVVSRWDFQQLNMFVLLRKRTL